MNNAVSRTAGLLSIAVFGIVMLQTFARRFEQSLQSIQLPQAAAESLMSQRFNLGGVNIPTDLDPALRESVRHAIDASFVAGFREVMLISAGLAVLSAVAAATMIRARSSPHPSRSH